MINKILQSVDDSLFALNQLKSLENVLFIETFAKELYSCFQRGNKVLVAGNGGSLCDAAHFAEELTGFFRQKRKALPAIALTDPGYLTCVGNDIGFESIFSRGVEAFGKVGDLFIGLSTSGRSMNIIRAFEVAKEKGLFTVSFLGKDGGLLKGFANLELFIHGCSTSDRIQEAHMAAMHIAIEIMESLMFENSSSFEKVLC